MFPELSAGGNAGGLGNGVGLRSAVGVAGGCAVIRSGAAVCFFGCDELAKW